MIGTTLTGDVATRWRAIPECSDAAAVRFLSFSALVETGCRRIVDDLLALYLGAERIRLGIYATSGAHFVLEECNGAGRQPVYVLREEAGRAHFFSSTRDAVAHLDHLLTTAAIRGLSTHLLVHAGSVALAGAGILVPGPSGVGKSTLVTALSMSGFRYLSDELAVVEMSSGDLLPFLKPICLKRAGWRVLKSEFQCATTVLDARRVDGQAVNYLTAPLPTTPETRIPIRHVILPIRTPGARATLERCPRSTALLELARNSLNLPRHGEAGVEALARLVEESDCHVLRYDGLRAAAEVILELAGRAPSTQVGSDNGLVNWPLPRSA